MKRLITLLAVVGLVIGTSFALTGCKKESDADKAIKQVEKTAEKAAEAAGDAAEKAGDKVEDMTD